MEMMHSQTDLISFIANQHLHRAAGGGEHLQLVQPPSQSCESGFSGNIIHWEQRKRSLTAVEPWATFPLLWQNFIHPHFLTGKNKRCKELQKEASSSHSSQSWNTLGWAPSGLQNTTALEGKSDLPTETFYLLVVLNLATEYFKIGILSANFMYKYMHTLLLKDGLSSKLLLGTGNLITAFT